MHSVVCNTLYAFAVLYALSLQANVVLEILLLSGNAVGEDGARHLMNALNINKSLQFLGLQGSNMSGECLHTLAALIGSCPDGI